MHLGPTFCKSLVAPGNAGMDGVHRIRIRPEQRSVGFWDKWGRMILHARLPRAEICRLEKTLADAHWRLDPSAYRCEDTWTRPRDHSAGSFEE